MKKLKHNKLKNTGLLFEVLSRAMMHEALNPERPQRAVKLIKQFFKTDSELLKELRLYNTLSNKTEHDPAELLSLSLQSRQTITESKLLKEKYDLVRSIKKYYDLETFINTRVSNYKLQASIFKLFEYHGKDSPEEYLSTKKLVLESLSGKVAENVVDEVEQAWREQDSDVRKLGFKMIVERFNEKYRELDDRQKKLLSKYINEDNSSELFKNYVIKEVGYIGKRLNQKIADVDDPVTKIKLTESINLLQTIVSAKQITEDHLSAMLKYYELIEVIE